MNDIFIKKCQDCGAEMRIRNDPNAWKVVRCAACRKRYKVERERLRIQKIRNPSQYAHEQVRCTPLGRAISDPGW